MERETAWCLVLLLLGLPPVHTSGEVTQGDLGFRYTKGSEKGYAISHYNIPQISN